MICHNIFLEDDGFCTQCNQNHLTKRARLHTQVHNAFAHNPVEPDVNVIKKSSLFPDCTTLTSAKNRMNQLIFDNPSVASFFSPIVDKAKLEGDFGYGPQHWATLFIVKTTDGKFRVSKVVAFENRRHNLAISMELKDFDALDEAQTTFTEVFCDNGFRPFGTDTLTIQKSGATIKAMVR